MPYGRNLKKAGNYSGAHGKIPNEVDISYEHLLTFTGFIDIDR